MPLYHLTADRLAPIPTTDFAAEGVLERADLQRLFIDQLDILLPDAMVLTDEFGDWDDSRRRIDLLALDREARLVVVELKRTANDSQLDLQAIRYAAMASTMTYEQAVAAHAGFLARRGGEVGQRDQVFLEAEAAVLDFLGWDEPLEGRFGQEVRIVLVAADFHKEITTSVLWLNRQDLDISCIRLRPHREGERVILDVQKIIPLPEAEDYLVRAKDKSREAHRAAREDAWAHGEGYWFVNVGETPANHRCWEDCARYGFVAVGSAPDGTSVLQRLRPGDRLFAYLNRHGYVGHGEVLATAVRREDFLVQAESKRLADMPLERQPEPETSSDPENQDWCIAVRWEVALPRGRAVKAPFRRAAVCQIHERALTRRLLDELGAADMQEN